MVQNRKDFGGLCPTLKPPNMTSLVPETKLTFSSDIWVEPGDKKTAAVPAKKSFASGQYHQHCLLDVSLGRSSGHVQPGADPEADPGRAGCLLRPSSCKVLAERMEGCMAGDGAGSNLLPLQAEPN